MHIKMHGKHTRTCMPQHAERTHTECMYLHNTTPHNANMRTSIVGARNQRLAEGQMFCSVKFRLSKVLFRKIVREQPDDPICQHFKATIKSAFYSSGYCRMRS